ncbi:MAG: phosphate ABC transporter permease subunit PstC [Caulobacteraceae bacterium]|nr:phosphate ABC transporter permease subunit PstC [Caulobacteraceae bacterium]
MFWIAILGLFLFSAAAFGLARRKASDAARAAGRRPNSLPGQQAGYVALWAFTPALILLACLIVFSGRIETGLIEANLPGAAAALEADQKALFVGDVHAIAEGRPTSAATWSGPLATARAAAVDKARDYELLTGWGGVILAGLVAVAGFLLALRRLSPDFTARRHAEGWIHGLLITCSALAVLTTVGIIASLLFESVRFFQVVSPVDFLTGLHWSPQTALREDQAGSAGAFGAVPLFVGTLLIMTIAMVVAAPIGLYAAIYLSEYAGPRLRAWVKPVLEILAGIPTVVFGVFAALTVGPAFAAFFKWIGGNLVGGPLDGVGQYLVQVQPNMALAAGVVMGVMLIPFISSLSDDILNAVPQSLRDGSYAMGATKSETVKKVVLPAALPGVAGAFILAVSRAIGETMIVLLALGSGGGTNLTFNPLDAVSTVTVQIVSLLTGDLEFDRPTTMAAFGLGLTLFVVTLTLNIIALRIVQAYREQYD